jgi:hypothetical protein
MQDPRKRELLEAYLKQQQEAQQSANATSSAASGSVGGGGGRIEQALVHAPDNMSLEEFKHQVKMWMELDNQIKKMNEILKEKKAVQKILTEKVLSFMARYNIEDLNTKDGKLRYKVTQVKPTVKQTAIKKKLQDFFDYDKALSEKVMKAVFDDAAQPKVEKPSLRRLKGVNIISV